MLPKDWNRSRTTALAVTVVLHVLMGLWLLALRFERPSMRVVESGIVWLPIPPTEVPLEALPEALPRVQPIQPFPDPVPLPEPVPSESAPDWHAAARDVAGAIGGGPGRRTFGETPEAPATRPKEETPPSIWKKPLPRVGTTVTTPDGETIIWVSDYCYVSIGTRSLTMAHIHEGRQGVRTCVLYQFGGEKKARDDLFDPNKRPPAGQQKPGCGPGEEKESCAP